MNIIVFAVGHHDIRLVTDLLYPNMKNSSSLQKMSKITFFNLIFTWWLLSSKSNGIAFVDHLPFKKNFLTHAMLWRQVHMLMFLSFKSLCMWPEIEEVRRRYFCFDLSCLMLINVHRCISYHILSVMHSLLLENKNLKLVDDTFACIYIY